MTQMKNRDDNPNRLHEVNSSEISFGTTRNVDKD